VRSSGLDEKGRSNRSPEGFLERLAPPARQAEARSIPQDDHVVTVEERVQLADRVDPHDVASVDAHEPLGIQPRLERPGRSFSVTVT